MMVEPGIKLSKNHGILYIKHSDSAEMYEMYTINVSKYIFLTGFRICVRQAFRGTERVVATSVAGIL